MSEESGRRVGRRRRSGTNAPPVWFGFPFAGGGLFALILGLTVDDREITGSRLPFIAVGLLFFVVGIALVWTSLRANRLEHRGPRVNVGAFDVERFTRSPMGVFVDFVAAPLAGVAFLGLAVFLLFSPAFPFAIIAGFFGILMLKGAAVTIRRGISTTLATVGPDGLWTPELGKVPWSELAELRIEDATGVGGRKNTGTAVYRRLGIVPRSPQLIANAPGRDAVGMVKGFGSLMNTIRPGANLSDPSRLAPYGISAHEIEQPFEEVVRSIQRFAEVVGAEVALGDGTRLVEAAGVAEPEPASQVAAPAAPSLFDAVGLPAPALAGTSVLSGTPFAPVERAPAAAPESRTFTRTGGPIGTFGIISDVATVLPWIGLPGISLVIFPAAFLLDPQAEFSPMLLVVFAFMLIPLGFAAYGISLLLDMPARWRIRRDDPNVLKIDGNGIELTGMGRLRWTEIEAVRVINSNRPTGEYSPQISRLEIVPRDRSRLATRPVWDRRRDAWRSFIRRLKPVGNRSPVEPCFALDFDLLDANPNEVIDLIARYRVVEDET